MTKNLMFIFVQFIKVITCAIDILKVPVAPVVYAETLNNIAYKYENKNYNY